MSALTDDRNTPMRDGAILSVPAAGDKKFFAGALTAINDAGYATPAANIPGLRGAGRCESTMDTNGSANGEIMVAIRKGIFRYDNDDDKPVCRGNIGSDCYILDDHTVSRSRGSHKGQSRPRAGKIFDVDSEGVWIKFD